MVGKACGNASYLERPVDVLVREVEEEGKRRGGCILLDDRHRPCCERRGAIGVVELGGRAQLCIFADTCNVIVVVVSTLDRVS